MTPSFRGAKSGKMLPGRNFRTIFTETKDRTGGTPPPSALSRREGDRTGCHKKKRDCRQDGSKTSRDLTQDRAIRSLEELSFKLSEPTQASKRTVKSTRDCPRNPQVDSVWSPTT